MVRFTAVPLRCLSLSMNTAKRLSLFDDAKVRFFWMASISSIEKMKNVNTL